MKQALINVAKEIHPDKVFDPKTKQEWAMLAKDLNIKVVHIAERDTQTPRVAKRRGEFVNTWSVDGFMGEGIQPAELGWGTHEKQLPPDGRHHDYGCGSAIYLERPSFTTRVLSWTPMEGNYLGFLITHNEAISITDYFTVKNENNDVIYRPTCHYAYHPCDSAVLSIHELIGKSFKLDGFKKRLVIDEIVDGVDELGVLLCGHKKNAYWYGSQLSIDTARILAPYNSATSLQVTSSVLAGIIWAIENPSRGVVEADEMDYERILEICMPYLGNVVGVYTDWNPLYHRSSLFPQDIDQDDPWQFKNVRLYS
jgi:homospermidine synthase